MLIFGTLILLGIVAIVIALSVMRSEARDEDVSEPVRPDWLYGEGGQAPGKPSLYMVVPKKYPLLRTRHSKVIR